MTGEFLITLAAFPFYVFACYYFVKLAYKQGKKRQWRVINRILIALCVFIAFNYPVGSTFIPGMIVMPGYCENAGFTLYKTPEQWMLENPGVAQTLKVIKGDNQDDKQLAENKWERVFHLNQRFDWRIEQTNLDKNIKQEEQTLVDIKTKEVLAKRLDYRLRAEPIYGIDSCFKKEERGKWVINDDNFRTLLEKFIELGEQK